eukprot:CAMPEP_0176500142 /NCGR_PEP_ID=MMETSP0200_2-20121128/13355_1 /TAXON_ID=947934 /ORGANISM="Chaetoceros sp., Strain GSL56" /LENGTH=613 /DNA_ID=CAMNT_0017898713 /DNA_START=40 /DNA_END=1878 /DNA_ORIENTATION=+
MRYFAFLLSSQIALTLSFVPASYNQFIHGLNLCKSPNKAFCPLSASSSPAQTSNAEDPLERTKKQLEKLSDMPSAFDQDEEILYRQLLMKPANALKDELKSLKLQTNGRKPDLAKRLVEYYTSHESKTNGDNSDDDLVEVVVPQWADVDENQDIKPIRTFAGLSLSNAAGGALARAGFTTPTPIQASALPLISKQKESLILHAETGSGKTLCYLLPITERAWRDRDVSNVMGGDEHGSSYALVLTPTRELAAQVAGVATCLAPPGSVRLVTMPTNLVRECYEAKEKSQGEYGGRFDNVLGGTQGMKIIVGSAKSIYLSLFGDSKLYPPTSKPEAKNFLSNVNYLVLDEVDRLFNIKTGRGKTSKYYTKHDKPAAIMTSSISKFTLGQMQVVAASATVGRPLRREMARVLGLAPDECPRVIRPSGFVDGTTTSRSVTAPASLTHYVMPCDGSTRGGLLTSAAFVVKGLPRPQDSSRGRRTLFVITKACGIPLRDAIGALKHFNIQPEPKSMLDVLEADGTDRLIETYREVSGAAGLGVSSTKVAFDKSVGYLLVTGEESVRGIHLDDLDTVVIVGRPKTPDEYIHIAGRAGRAGKKGNVVNILSYEQTSALSSW